LGWLELGEAAAIDQAISDWRATLADPRRADVRARGRALDEQIMRPLRRLLGDTRRLFLSPDGALNLIPFAALVDEQDRYLAETYAITYLTSGRDLLRLAVKTSSRQGPAVFADPDFDAAAAAPNALPNTPHASARRSVDLAGARFPRLPGTAAEARVLAALLPAPHVFTRAQATEGALKQVAAPLVLHVATHGFFLPAQQSSSGASVPPGLRGLGLGGGRAAPAGENPLLRSGLALAGANRRADGAGGDGVLTAYEAAALDLFGTRLVVLSACETGLGDVQSGDGVYGLRRALVLAGAESQMMSLWQVSDAATRDLMTAYYRRLLAGGERGEALRQVQLAMIKRQPQAAAAGGRRGLGGGLARQLQTEERRHPFYWASFILSGEWRALDDPRGRARR
jgi:CHAT domain-containing protein